MYEEFFGLREQPFRLNLDPRFLWLSETHREGLATLAYGIATGTGFILLTGGAGSGKSTLLRALLRQVRDRVESVLITNTESLGDLELLKLVVAELGIRERPGDRAECLSVLKESLWERASSGMRTVLVVDEAQNLGAPALEQLRLLSNFETEREKLIQIILSGQSGLRRKLAMPQLRSLSQRIVISHQVEPLRPYEIRPYLEHRINVAGGHYEDILQPGAESTFFTYSGGCPRLVSGLADRALLSAFAQGVRPVPPLLVEMKAKELETERADDLWEADIWG